MHRTNRIFGAAVIVFAMAASLVACGDRETAGKTAAAITQADVQSALDTLQTSRPDVAGFAVAVILTDGTLVSAATGQADPDGRALTPATPLRIASITKTFVAASILRLWEEDLIDLDAPLARLISTEHNALLVSDGYDTDAITVRHLLMHASGMNDHFSGDAYKGMVIAEPTREWTRGEQISVMVETSDPVGAPGDGFSYSDTGYLLLGEVIENLTGEPLGQAVKRLTKLENVVSDNVWWDAEDTPPAGAPVRAHQWLGDIDTFNIHGSVDAFGGGGIVASVEDTARFFRGLFAGDVFKEPETLALMTEAPGRPEGSPYRMGLFVGDKKGYRTFGHGGFWGTDVFVSPELNIVIAGASLNATAIGELRQFEADLLDIIAEEE